MAMDYKELLELILYVFWNYIERFLQKYDIDLRKLPNVKRKLLVSNQILVLFKLKVSSFQKEDKLSPKCFILFLVL